MAVMLIASVMLLGIVPVGLVSRPATVSAEGEFLRLSPAAETFVSSKPEERTLSGSQIAPGIVITGGSYDAYYKFDLRNLLDKDPEEIHDARLRLGIVNAGGEPETVVRLWLMPEVNWNENMNYTSRPSEVGEIKLCETAVNTQNNEIPLEADLTEYLKKWVEDGREFVALHLDILSPSVTISFAGSGYEDPAYRPGLKVVTGSAQDPDLPVLSKSELTAAETWGSTVPYDCLAAGGGAETYLRFRFQKENIKGAVYLAQLQLQMLSAEEGAEFAVYQVLGENTETAENAPGQKELLLYSTSMPDAGRLRSIDLTDIVNDTLSRGEEELVLRLAGGGSGQTVFAGGEDAPRLAMRVSDDYRVQAAVEASVHMLGENTDPEAVTSALSDGYTAPDGVYAEIRWTAEDAETGENVFDVLEADGTVNRPRWFEPAERIKATGRIVSGSCVRERAFYLTILPEEAPNYTGESFDSCVYPGLAESEVQQRFESENCQARSRWVGTKNFAYRTLDQDGMMVLNLACDSEKQNYLTVKIWMDDGAAETLAVQNLAGSDSDWIVLSGSGQTPETDGGFLYRTYPLPEEMTRGKEFVSLGLRLAPEAEADTQVNIYGAYLTQSPYFDPLAFAQQGEEVAGKEPITDTAFYKFLERLYLVTRQPVLELWEQTQSSEVVAGPEPADEKAVFGPEPAGNTQTGASGLDNAAAVQNSAAAQQTQTAAGTGAETAAGVQKEYMPKSYTWVDEDTHTVLFRSGGDQIAVSMPRDGKPAQVRRNGAYYDTYSEVEAEDHENGITTVHYGKYEILLNRTGTGAARIPVQGLEGIYQDLVSGEYYSFLGPGALADDSVLPEGAQLKNGKTAVLEPGNAMILEFLAEPLYTSDWRVSAVNGVSVSRIEFAAETPIQSVSVKNVGRISEETEDLQIICAVYERGILAGAARQETAAVAGQGEYTVSFADAGLSIRPGQTMKIFIEPSDGTAGAMTPKLELP